MNYMLWLWLGAMVVFGIVEALTAGLVSIWFVIGSAAALIGALCARTAAPVVMTDAQRREAGGSEYTLYCVMHPEDGTLAVRQEIVY